ncbi:MAG: ankyrin repeat domain-containing protein [Planctomycetota bacterium]|jgi:pectate lyase
MRSKYTTHRILENVLFVIALAAFLPANSSAEEDSKYLDAVREFADNVLKYGRDTYGPKHTPLFVDGLNIHTHEPVKWIDPDGYKWILSNLASQQNLLRTLDGLTKITGDPKYKQAAMEPIAYAFENLRSPNGLLYWGESSAYDAKGDKVYGLGLHCFKANYPYYELMWEVNPEATEQFIESLWASHILDWSNLDLNRIGPLDELSVPKGWDHEYTGGPVPFESKLAWSASFSITASDLFYAGAKLFKFSSQEKPLTWAKRLAHRYIETRDPRTGISCYTFTVPKDAPKHPLADDFKGHGIHQGTFLFHPAGGDPLVHPVVNRCVLHDFICSPGVYSDAYVGWWICQFLLSEMLGENGKEFQQWALEELSAWGKVAYRKQANSWIPMLTDGTSLEGYVLQRDTYLGIKGTVCKGYKADCTDFWAYALAYKVTNDKFMWQMARNIAIGNSLGDIGAESQEDPQLRFGTDCSHPHAILGFLSLYESTGKMAFLNMTKKVGDNILVKRFHKGFFIPSEKHIYAKFDAIESSILLHIHAALSPDCPSLPPTWPTLIRFGQAYRYKDLVFDNTLIYTLTEFAEPPISLNEAAATGNLDLTKSLMAEGLDVNYREDATLKTPLHRAVMGGHKQVVELLLANGADVNAGKLTALHYAAEKGHTEIAEMLITKGANVNLTIAEGYRTGDTPLHSAIRANHKDIVELLVVKGADVNAKDRFGQTPLDIAMSRKRTDIVELLRNHEAEE